MVSRARGLKNCPVPRDAEFLQVTGISGAGAGCRFKKRQNHFLHGEVNSLEREGSRAGQRHGNQRDLVAETGSEPVGRIGKLANSAGLKIRSLVVHGFESHSSHTVFLL